MSQLKKHPSDPRMSQNSTKITTPETNIRQHLKHWGLEDSNFLLARSGQVRIASLGESKYHPVCLRLWTSLEYGYLILWEAIEVALFHSFPESEGPIIIYLHIYSHGSRHSQISYSMLTTRVKNKYMKILPMSTCEGINGINSSCPPTGQDVQPHKSKGNKWLPGYLQRSKKIGFKPSIRSII